METAMFNSAEQLLAAAREQGLQLTAKRPELDGSGADFIVVHAVDEHGTPWVVRSPRRPDVLERAAAERRALALVRARIPAAVPDWRLFSPQVIAYPRLGGEPAAVIDMSAGGYVWCFDEKNPPAVFIDSLASFLAALHGIAEEDAVAAGLSVQRPSQIREAYARRMERSREVLNVPDAVWRRWQAWLAGDSYWPEHSALVHGDLHPAHILVNEERRVTGILDWTEAHVGDPATDFALQYATLGRGTLSALLERYRASGGRAWARMEEHVVEMWAAYPVVIAEFALATGEEGPRHLAQSLVDAAAQELSGSS
jgi:macrolide phosphotransferase